ncbi:heme biosynthesis protein HemY [Phyllobacterium salinisoli]|uniref:Heme biosynthesis protein HemY n=1 Tax=Phyllobacterium salinisoli TaxID=1899321 RepID=A0A368JZ72_9HYPH|nr:heme biosynthesis protein HemY [Phyllobacterium salinisoli]RCS22427.1 heme biosynthesis protein HemY [Phyllobacterium salinisoli]
MLRILFFVLVVLVLGGGFAWLADRPGDLTITFAGMRYEVTLMVAATAVVAVVAAVMLIWWLIKSIIRSPYALQRHFRARKRDRGYQSLSTGLIAAGAGDARAARNMAKQAGKLLNVDQEPLIKLLEAQTAMLEGRTGDARAKFEAMLDDPETRLLGLRGLYIEAQRAGARDAAQHYAAEASKLAPHVEWASGAVLGRLSVAGDWDEALKLLDARKADQQTDKETAKKERAALLTAKAISTFDSDPAGAKTAALEAHKLAPDLVPAAVIAARALFRQDDLRKGTKILETAWKSSPHPDIAQAYVHARPGDSVLDRLKRARRLFTLRPNNPEASLALAHAALDAGEFKLARENAEAVLRMAPRESAYLLLADIEEGETKDQGRVRQWLSRAVKAPRDPAWTADGFVSEQWAPVSPVTGRLNAFEWKVPVEQLPSMIDLDPDVRGPEPETPALPVIIEPEPAAPQPTRVEAITTTPAKDEKQPEPQPKPKGNEAKPTRDKGDKGEEVKMLVVDDPGVIPDEKAEDTQTRFRLF